MRRNNLVRKIRSAVEATERLLRKRTCDCELARTYLHGLNLHQKERFDVLSLSYLFSFFFSLFFFFITKERESTLQLCLSHFFSSSFFLYLSFFLSITKESKSQLVTCVCLLDADRRDGRMLICTLLVAFRARLFCHPNL